jgi:ribosomal protein L19
MSILNNIISTISEKKLKMTFKNKFKIRNPFIKGFPITIYTLLDTNYFYSFSGIVINIRRRGFISSVKVRSRRFGAEQRFFIFAPQLKSDIVCFHYRWYGRKNKKKRSIIRGK